MFTQGATVRRLPVRPQAHSPVSPLPTAQWLKPLNLDDLRVDHTRRITTGISTLDARLRGMFRGDLVLLAGLPHHGKSLLAQSIAVNLATEGKGTLWLTADEDRAKVAYQLAAMNLDVPADELEDDPDGPLKVMAQFDGPLRQIGIAEEVTSFQGMGQAVDEYADLHNRLPDVVVYDYVGYLQGTGGRSSYEQAGTRFDALKRFSRRLTDTVTIGIHQSNRTGAFGRPSMQSLSHGGEQQAMQILWVENRVLLPDVYPEEDPVWSERQPALHLWILKNKRKRNGVTHDGLRHAVRPSGAIEPWTPEHHRAARGSDWHDAERERRPDLYD